MTCQASIKRMKKNNGSPNLIELPNREKHDLRIGGTCGWERGWIPFAHNFGTYFVVDFEPQLGRRVKSLLGTLKMR